jgi:CDP-diacylglycerol--serine O-phosphatidyltransferase
MNLLSGSLACIAAFSAFDEVAFGLQGYQVAYILIGMAAVFDFFDGFVARLLHTVSSIGKELDSLCDAVSFGLAPAFILYMMMHTANPGSYICFAAMLIPIFGALRLARFNVDTNQATVFTGLAIPSNAIFWIGFTAWYATHHTLSEWIVLAFIVALSLLMVSNLRMFSLKIHSFGIKENFRLYLLIIAAIIFILIAGLPGLAWTIIFYVLLCAFSNER